MSLEWQRPLAGGLLIGAAVATLALGNRQLAGISGIFGRVLRGDLGAQAWRVLFLLGLVAPAALAGTGPVQHAGGLAWLAAAGLLVGAGTRLANGCTSGHGVCGLAQASPRSLAATLVFMASAAVTVFFVRHAWPA